MTINYLNWSQNHINSNATNLFVLTRKRKLIVRFLPFRLSSDYRDNDGNATVGTGGQTAV